MEFCTDTGFIYVDIASFHVPRVCLKLHKCPYLVLLLAEAPILKINFRNSIFVVIPMNTHTHTHPLLDRPVLTLRSLWPCIQVTHNTLTYAAKIMCMNMWYCFFVCFVLGFKDCFI